MCRQLTDELVCSSSGTADGWHAVGLSPGRGGTETHSAAKSFQKTDLTVFHPYAGAQEEKTSL